MHRAYHALPPMRSPTGVPQHVVYGFISVLIKLFADLKPTHMAVAFDRPGPTFREKLFTAYQQQRPKMEDDFISQIQLVHEVVAAFGIPFYEADGFEADDVIGTIASKGFDGQIIIVTGDRDILQLVRDEKVLLFMPTKGISEGKLYGEKDVMERMGVSPSLIPDFKGLAGDPSDNYPGIVGVGPKTAVKLLAKYKTLQSLLKSDEFTEEQKQSARLSYELATIRKDAPIKIDFTSMKIDSLNTPKVITALEAFPFPSLIKRITGGVMVKKEEIKKVETDTTQQALF